MERYRPGSGAMGGVSRPLPTGFVPFSNISQHSCRGIPRPAVNAFGTPFALY